MPNATANNSSISVDRAFLAAISSLIGLDGLCVLHECLVHPVARLAPQFGSPFALDARIGRLVGQNDRTNASKAPREAGDPRAAARRSCLHRRRDRGVPGTALQREN